MKDVFAKAALTIAFLGLLTLAPGVAGCAAGVVAGGLAAHTELEQEGKKQKAIYKTWLHNDAELEKAEPELLKGQTLVADDPDWQSCHTRMKECKDESCSKEFVQAFNTVLRQRYFSADTKDVDTECKSAQTCGDARSVEMKFVASHEKHLGELIAARKAQNRAKFDAGDLTAMNTFSDDLAKEITSWRTSASAKAVCK